MTRRPRRGGKSPALGCGPSRCPAPHLHRDTSLLLAFGVSCKVIENLNSGGKYGVRSPRTSAHSVGANLDRRRVLDVRVCLEAPYTRRSVGPWTLTSRPAAPSLTAEDGRSAPALPLQGPGRPSRAQDTSGRAPQHCARGPFLTNSKTVNKNHRQKHTNRKHGSLS